MERTLKTLTQSYGVVAAEVPLLLPARLRLSGPPKGGVAFADRWRSAPKRGQRVICGEMLANCWGAGRALALPIGQSVKLGRLEIRLGHAGSSPEASLLKNVHDGQRLTCALAARWPASPGSESADVTDSDVILIDASHLHLPRSPDQAVLTALRSALSQNSVALWVDDWRIAIAMSHALATDDLEILFGPGVIAPNRRFGATKSRPWRKALRTGQLGIWPLSARGRAPGHQRSLALLNHSDAGDLHWRIEPDVDAASELIALSGAHTALLWGSRAEMAESLAAQLKSVDVIRLESDSQLSLV